MTATATLKRRPKALMAAHGTRSRYTNQRCRCEDCTAANNRYHLAQSRSKQRE